MKPEWASVLLNKCAIEVDNLCVALTRLSVLPTLSKNPASSGRSDAT